MRLHLQNIHIKFVYQDHRSKNVFLVLHISCRCQTRWYVITGMFVADLLLIARQSSSSSSSYLLVEIRLYLCARLQRTLLHLQVGLISTACVLPHSQSLYLTLTPGNSRRVNQPWINAVYYRRSHGRHRSLLLTLKLIYHRANVSGLGCHFHKLCIHRQRVFASIC